MIKKFLYILFFLIPIAFAVMVIFFYFSEKNINLINKSRSKTYTEVPADINKLPLLKNNTSNIIEYISDSNGTNKKKYNKFFELIGNN